MTLVSLLLMGCTVPFSTSFGSDLEMGLTLDQNCTGTDTIEEDGNTTTYTLATDGENCTLDVDWSGALMSQDVLDAEVEEALEGTPGNRSNITITAASLTLETIRLVDGSGAPVAIDSFPTWDVALQLGSGDLYTASGSDVPTLLASPVTVPLNDAQLDLLTAAVQGTGSLDATGTAMLSMPIDELPTTPTDMALEFEADMDLDAEVGL